MKPPFDIDLNDSFSCCENNIEDINRISDMNLAPSQVPVLLLRDEFNFDLNQAPTQISFGLNQEASCVEEQENETEVEITEAHPLVVDLSQALTQIPFGLNQEAPCVEEEENETEVEIHEAQPLEVDARHNSEIEHDYEQSNQHMELDESEAIINSDGIIILPNSF